MNQLLPILLLVLPLVACGSRTPEDKLQGTWQISEATIEAMVDGAEIPPEMEAMMESMKAEAKKMTLAFLGDGTFEMKMLGPDGLQTFGGTYEITASEGDRITVEMDKDGEKDSEVFTVEGDTLSFEESGETLTFHRK